MDTKEIRLECLRLSRSDFPSAPADKRILERATTYADFVFGRNHRPEPVQNQPANPEPEADPHIVVNPGHEITGYVSPPTT